MRMREEERQRDRAGENYDFAYFLASFTKYL